MRRVTADRILAAHAIFADPPSPERPVTAVGRALAALAALVAVAGMAVPGLAHHGRYALVGRRTESALLGIGRCKCVGRCRFAVHGIGLFNQRGWGRLLDSRDRRRVRFILRCSARKRPKGHYQNTAEQGERTPARCAHFSSGIRHHNPPKRCTN